MKILTKIFFAAAGIAVVGGAGYYGYRRFKGRAVVGRPVTEEKVAVESTSMDVAAPIEAPVVEQHQAIHEQPAAAISQSAPEPASALVVQGPLTEVRVKKVISPTGELLALSHSAQMNGENRHSWRVLTSNFTRYVKSIRQGRWCDVPGYRTVLSDMPNGAVTIQIFKIDPATGISCGELVGITRQNGKMYCRMGGSEMRNDQESIIDGMLKIEYIQLEQRRVTPIINPDLQGSGE